MQVKQKRLQIDKKKIAKEILNWIICIVIAIVLALIIKYFLFTPTIVKQSSMYPTLKEDQRLILNRVGRTFKQMPKRGDIITFEAPSVTYRTKDDTDLSNPIAIFTDTKDMSLKEKFDYNILETTKISYIKRVIGLPGDHVQIKEGKVFVNGEELQEDYLQPGVVTDMLQANGKETGFSDIIVPQNCVFAMGDNRPGSTDSRAFGCIPLEKIEGTVSFRFWPFSKFGGVE